MSLYIHDDVEVEREVIALEDYLYDAKFKLIHSQKKVLTHFLNNCLCHNHLAL